MATAQSETKKRMGEPSTEEGAAHSGPTAREQTDADMEDSTQADWSGSEKEKGCKNAWNIAYVTKGIANGKPPIRLFAHVHAFDPVALHPENVIIDRIMCGDEEKGIPLVDLSGSINFTASTLLK